jgi:hypothetical protein
MSTKAQGRYPLSPKSPAKPVPDVFPSRPTDGCASTSRKSGHSEDCDKRGIQKLELQKGSLSQNPVQGVSQCPPAQSRDSFKNKRYHRRRETRENIGQPRQVTTRYGNSAQAEKKKRRRQHK